MRLVHLFLFSLAGLTSLVVAALFILPVFVDWGRFLPQISQELSQRLGREVSITGEVDFVLFPAPALSVGEMRLSNHPGGHDRTMLTLEGMEARLALAPLLSGDIRITRLHLRRPILTLEHFAEGGTNWQGLDWSENGPAGALDNIRLDHFTLEDGVFRQLDHRTGRARIIGGIEGEIRADSLFGPFSAEGHFLYTGERYRVKTHTGRFGLERATPFNVQISRREESFTLDFSGLAGPPAPTRDISGTLNLSTGDIVTLLARPGQEHGLPELPLRLEAGLAFSGRRTELHDIKADLAANKISGGVEMVFAGSRPQMRVILSGDALDVGDAAPGRALETLQSAAGLISSAAQRWGVNVPENAPVSLEADFISLNWGGQKVRDVSFVMEATAGQVQSAKLLAMLPGVTRFSLEMERPAGRAGGEIVAPIGGMMRFTTLAPETMLLWLTAGQSESYLKSLEAGLLAQWEGEARFRLTPSALLLDEALFLLAGSALTASGRYMRAERAFDLVLDAGKFGLTRHGSALAGLALPFLTGARPAQPGFSLSATLNLPTITLDGRDFAAAKGRLIWRDRRLALDNWEIQLRREGHASLQGMIDFTGPVPAAQIEGNTRISDSAALLALAGISLPARQAGALANIEAVVKFELPGEGPGEKEKEKRARLTAEGKAGKSAFVLNAALTPWDEWDEPSSGWLEAVLEASNPAASTLLRQAGLPLALNHGRGEGRIKLDLTGSLAGEAKVRAELASGQAHYYYVGTIARGAGDIFSAEGRVGARAPEWGVLTSSLGFLSAPPAVNPPFSLVAEIEKKQTSWRWRNLRLTLGDKEIRVAGLFDRRANGSSYLEAELEAGFFDAGWILPASEQGWPTAPLLGTSDAGLEGEIKFSAARLAAGPFSFTDAAAQIGLTGGGWHAQDFKAGLAGGTLTGAIELAPGARFTFNAGLTLAGAKAELLTPMLWGREAASGVLDISGSLTGKGRSPLAIISSLEGEGQAGWRDPVLYGFDASLLDRAISKAANPAQLGKILAHAPGLGQTRLGEVSARFSVENGLVSLPSVTLAETAEGVSARLKAFADLPRALVDMEWRFRLPANKDLPDLFFLITGPLASPDARADSFELEQGFSARIIEKGIRQVETGGELPPDLLELLGIEPEPLPGQTDGEAPPATP